VVKFQEFTSGVMLVSIFAFPMVLLHTNTIQLYNFLFLVGGTVLSLMGFASLVLMLNEAKQQPEMGLS